MLSMLIYNKFALASNNVLVLTYQHQPSPFQKLIRARFEILWQTFLYDLIKC